MAIGKAGAEPLGELAALLKPFSQGVRHKESKHALERYSMGLLSDIPGKTVAGMGRAMPGTNDQQPSGRPDRTRQTAFRGHGQKQRIFGGLHYGAHSWNRRGRVISRIEHTTRGSNPRYGVTILPGNSRQLHERNYCARGEMENRIKEQMQLF